MIVIPPIPKEYNHQCLVYQGDNEKLKEQNLLFTPDECDRIISTASSGGKPEEARLARNDRELNKDIRSTDNWALDFDQHTHWVYKKLTSLARLTNEEVFRFNVTGCLICFQVLKYSKGSHYTWHVDNDHQSNSTRKLSVSVLLSPPSEFRGGDLQLFTAIKPVDVPLKHPGSVVIFPSYVLHRVKKVTWGERWSLVAWFDGPPFC